MTQVAKSGRGLTPADIELLLGRAQVELPVTGIEGRKFLVTGAGGTIGVAIVRELLAARAKSVVLVEQSEYALYRVCTEEHGDDHRLVPRLCSYGSEECAQTLKVLRPDCVVHAGAYKHVPLCELNPVTAVKNNVLEFDSLVRSCEAHLVPELLVVSSDKAVRPTTIMGATKALVEAVAINCKVPSVHVVRFGNVLGSSGSVLQLWDAQRAAGKPLTLTHRSVTRYFMSVSEAARLVLRSRECQTGVLTLAMGEAVRIEKLMRRYLEYVGDSGYKTRVVGLRPGEKLHEELSVDGLEETAVGGVFRDGKVPGLVDLTELRGAVVRGDLLDLRGALYRVLRSYRPVVGLVDDVFLEQQSQLLKTETDDCYAPPVPAVQEVQP